MSEGEVDRITGTVTTGHEWNGIKELDTPVPRAVLLFIFVTHLWAVGYWILMPAWPLVTTYTSGLLGISQRVSVEQQLVEQQQVRQSWTGRVAELSFDQIAADEALMTKVTEAGHQLFGDNCAVCHGRGASGNAGYPDLTDGDWLWGDGSPEAIAETLRVGVNAQHDETRISQMPAFGREQMLTAPEVRSAAAYVFSLSHPDYSTAENLGLIDSGKEVFAANCAGCHGEAATGDQAAGVPNLTDSQWIYGGELENIVTSVHGGRQGHMPTWDERLSAEEIKMLAVYVHSLNTAKP
jgi:cytochrome c oxidase cbb3-type subunit III